MRIASSQHANPDNDCDWVRFVTRPQQISRDEAKKKSTDKKEVRQFEELPAPGKWHSLLSVNVSRYFPRQFPTNTHTHTRAGLKLRVALKRP